MRSRRRRFLVGGKLPEQRRQQRQQRQQQQQQQRRGRSAVVTSLTLQPSLSFSLVAIFPVARSFSVFSLASSLVARGVAAGRGGRDGLAGGVGPCLLR